MQHPAVTWDDLRVLLAVQRHQSFLAAAQALGLSTSTVARRIEALEASLGRPLVQRSTAGTSVEADSWELVALAEQFELGLGSARRNDGAHGASTLAGSVRISVGEGFAGFLTELLCEFRRRHPETSVELIAETRLADLARREADLGIRVVRSPSKVLVERNLGVLHFGLYASETYVERRLRAARLRPGEYQRHDFVGFDGAHRRLPQEQWLVAQGATRFPFRTNSDAVMLAAVVGGQGIAVLPDLLGRATPSLVRLEVDTRLPSLSPLLVFHKEARQVPRIRAVAHAIEEAAKARLGR